MLGLSDYQRKQLSGSRAPSWEVTLLDNKDFPIRRVVIENGSVEIAPYEKLKGSASLTLSDITGIDFLSHRVKITYHTGIIGIKPWDVGVYVFTSPKEYVYEHGRIVYEVDLLTKLALLDSVELSEPLSIETGANLVESAASLVASVDANVVYTPSTETAREAMTFPTGENLLKVVNELLQAANYWSVMVSGTGMFTLEPYSDPDSREVSWEFLEGEESITIPDMSMEQDLTSVPNKVICHTSGTDTQPALVAVAINDDPKSPYSITSRGRVITKTYQVDAASQETLQQLAYRRLQESSSPVATYEISHGIVPGLRGHDVVLLSYKDTIVKTTVQKMSMNLTFDSLSHTVLRRGK